MDRAFIRKTMQNKRQQLSAPLRQKACSQICQFILNETWFQESTRIAFYQAARSELDPQPLIEQAWKSAKICYLPICDPSLLTLSFVPYYPGDPLFRNCYGILEPSIETHPPIEPDILDIAFLPLLAFDSHGNRLGSGKGYYDRTFAYMRDSNQLAPKPKLMGLAYAFQEVEKLDVQTWDIPLDKIIVFDTERHAVLFNQFF